jgi:arylsulfatase A-like enzyme
MCALVVAAEYINPTRPNVLFISSDDLDWGDPGCHGDP